MKSSWWRLFDQVIYIYLISCWIKLNCRVELSSQASQLDSSSRVQLLNSTQHFFKKISTRLDTFQVEYSTWCDQSNWRAFQRILKSFLSNLWCWFIEITNEIIKCCIIHSWRWWIIRWNNNTSHVLWNLKDLKFSSWWRNKLTLRVK